jgi:hypothetical protein
MTTVRPSHRTEHRSSLSKLSKYVLHLANIDIKDIATFAVHDYKKDSDSLQQVRNVGFGLRFSFLCGGGLPIVI